MQIEHSQYPKTTNQPFIIKVKLLSNQVYDFTIDPHMKVIEFKKLIEGKVNVPITRQRLVYGGRQLTDENSVIDMVKQSGITIHLVAKREQTSQQPSNNINEQQQSSNNNNRVPPQPPIYGIPNIMNMVSSMMSGGGSGGIIQGQSGTNPSITIGTSGNNAADITQNLTNILGNLFRNQANTQQQQPQQNQQNQQNQQTQQTQQTQQNQQNQSNQQNQPNQQNQQNQPNQPNQPNQQNHQNQHQSNSFNHLQIPLSPIQNLNTALNSLTLLPEQIIPPTNNINLREQTGQYLRRFQHQMLRLTTQLNRGIQLLNQGRITHLPTFIPVFQAFRQSSTVAIEAINRLNENSISANLSATIIIQQNSNENEQISQQIIVGHSNNNQIAMSPPNIQYQYSANFSSNNQQQQQQQQQQVNNNNNNQHPSLSPPSSQQQQQQLQQSQQQVFNTHEQSRQHPTIERPIELSSQQFQQIPQNMMNFLLSPQLTGMINQQQSQSQQSSESNSQGPPPVLNFSQIFANLAQMGGISSLMNIPLSQMFPVSPIYLTLSKLVTGCDMVAMLTRKDFTFIDIKKVQIKQAVQTSIKQIGSQDKFIELVSNDLLKLILPKNITGNVVQCKRNIYETIHKRITQLKIKILASELEQGQFFSNNIVNITKKLICQTLFVVSKYVKNQDQMFKEIRQKSIQGLNKFIPMLSGFFYTFIENELKRIYREYCQELDRKEAMNENQLKNQKDLIEQILKNGEKDSENMSKFQHSQYYYPKPK